MFAQQAAEVIGGGAGWVGAGLLGGVLSWLLFVHLPAKDKQMKDLLDTKDSQINAILDAKWKAMMCMSADHREMVRSLAGEFRTAVTQVTAHYDQEVVRLLELIDARVRRGDRTRRGAGASAGQQAGQPPPPAGKGGV